MSGIVIVRYCGCMLLWLIGFNYCVALVVCLLVQRRRTHFREDIWIVIIGLFPAATADNVHYPIFHSPSNGIASNATNSEIIMRPVGVLVAMRRHSKFCI